MNVRPLDDRILVKRIDMPETGSIIKPECAKEISYRGIVKSVGPGRRTKQGKRIPCDVRVGDVVMFGPYTDFDQDDLVMVQEADIRYVEVDP